jgi:hypothetical protein
MNIGNTVIMISGGSIWWSGPPSAQADEAAEAAERLGYKTTVFTWTARDEVRLHTAIDARDICEICRACLASAGEAAETRRSACRGGFKAKRRAVRKAVETALAAAGAT